MSHPWTSDFSKSSTYLRGTPTYQTGLLDWASILIIGAFIESQCVAGKGIPRRGLPGALREGSE